MKKNILYISSLLIFFSCSKDLGNYNYNELPSYTVSEIKTGAGVSRNYDIVLGETLEITPVIESSSASNKEDLSFCWIVENDTVSQERDLKIVVDLPIALHQAQFVLTDNNTGLQYKTGFAINVTSPFGRGYFFLNQDEDNNTLLGFKAVSDAKNLVSNTDELKGRKFGKYPLNMNGVKKFKTGPTDYRWEVFVLSKESDYPVVYADLTTYAPIRYFDENSYLGNWSTEFNFKPTYVDLRAAGVTYFINDGRIAFFDNNNLYRHSLLFDNTPDYRLDNVLIGDIQRFSGFRSIIGFDLLSSKFKLISRYPASDPSKGIIYNANILDRVLDIENPQGVSYVGHKVVSSYSTYISSVRLLNSKVFSIKDNNIHLSEFVSSITSPYLPEIFDLGSQSIPGLTSNAPMAIYENVAGDAYLAANNIIYKSSIAVLNFAAYLQVDPSLGSVTAMKYQISSPGNNVTTPRLFVCTYDPQSTHKYKGSILVYDVNTKSIIHELKNVTNKVVDIFLGE